jgi:hypothetical protein
VSDRWEDAHGEAAIGDQDLRACTSSIDPSDASSPSAARQLDYDCDSAGRRAGAGARPVGPCRSEAFGKERPERGVYGSGDKAPAIQRRSG